LPLWMLRRTGFLGTLLVATDEKGQSLTEYALIIALIAVLCISTIALEGHQLLNMFDHIGNCIGSPGPSTC
jgi:Flp pilus assembly pilin Flp